MATLPALGSPEGAVQPCTMVIFGASGDLTHRMLLPALYNLALDGRLPARFAVVGFARTNWTNDEFREEARKAVEKYSRRSLDPAVWDGFAATLHYISGDYASDEAYDRLNEKLEVVKQAHGTEGNHLFYLAIPPGAFDDVVLQLGKGPHARTRDEDHGWSRKKEKWVLLF